MRILFFVFLGLYLMASAARADIDSSGDVTTLYLQQEFKKAEVITEIGQISHLLGQPLFCTSHSAYKHSNNSPNSMVFEDERHWVILTQIAEGQVMIAGSLPDPQLLPSGTYLLNSDHGLSRSSATNDPGFRYLSVMRISPEGYLRFEMNMSGANPGMDGLYSKSVSLELAGSYLYRVCFLPELNTARLPDGDYLPKRLRNFNPLPSGKKGATAPATKKGVEKPRLPRPPEID